MANGNVGSYGRFPNKGNSASNPIVEKRNGSPRKDYLKSINFELIKLNKQFEKFIKYVEETTKK